ncbi:hypothetical protein QQ045_017085 [Rhodiola kirilowii]
MIEENGSFQEQTVEFQKWIAVRSGLGDETYLLRGITSQPPRLNMDKARAEAEAVMFGSLDNLFKKIGIKPSQIGVLIVNCSLFNPTPSLTSMIVNHYKIKPDIKSFNLGGMGCITGLISIDLVKNLLKANPNTRTRSWTARRTSRSTGTSATKNRCSSAIASSKWVRRRPAIKPLHRQIFNSHDTL